MVYFCHSLFGIYLVRAIVLRFSIHQAGSILVENIHQLAQATALQIGILITSDGQGIFLK